MSGGRRDHITVGARISVADLAEAIDRPVSEVQEALDDHHEPSSPEDIVGPHMSPVVGRALGLTIEVEPRDLALESLYEIESRAGVDPTDVQGKAGVLIRGVLGEREDLDHEIEDASEHWSVARMPMIDRTILRLGLYELRHETATPTPVIVNEAVRLAKTYSTERSGAFVNGVLATLARSRRR